MPRSSGSRFCGACLSNGYDRWLAKLHFASTILDEHAFAQAMDQCQAILAVLSPAILRSPTVFQEIDIALACRRPVIVVQVAHLNEQDAAHFPATLWATPQVDLTLEEKGEAVRLLAALLPPVDSKPSDAETPKDAEPIEWNEETFSLDRFRISTPAT
jgi:hypothetical protein